jgi:hypothetical protein
MERRGKVSEAPPVGADAYMQVIVQVLGVPTFPSRSPTRWSRFRLAHFVADGRIAPAMSKIRELLGRRSLRSRRYPNRASCG